MGDYEETAKCIDQDYEDLYNAYYDDLNKEETIDVDYYIEEIKSLENEAEDTIEEFEKDITSDNPERYEEERNEEIESAICSIEETIESLEELWKEVAL